MFGGAGRNRSAAGETMNRYSAIFVSTLLLAGPAAARAQDAAAFLNDAAKAMHIENVHTVRYTATGSAYAIGQSYTAGGAYPRSSMPVTRAPGLREVGE